MDSMMCMFKIEFISFRLCSEVPNLRHIRTIHKRGLSQSERLTITQKYLYIFRFHDPYTGPFSHLLQAWKIEQDRLKEEEQSKKTKKEKGGKATPKVGERMDSVKENKKTPLSSRKSRENMSKTPSSATLPRDKTRDIPETPQEPANERRTNV